MRFDSRSGFLTAFVACAVLGSGTAEATSPVRIKDINTQARMNIKFLTSVGANLYFTADDGLHGQELWKSDGTVAGSAIVKDILPGAAGSHPYDLVDVGGALYFTIRQEAVSEFQQTFYELWRSDGTEPGTVLLRTFPARASWIYPQIYGPTALTLLNGSLYFLTNDGDGHLWRTDGTPAGTVLVKDTGSQTIPPPRPTGFMTQIVGLTEMLVMNGSLYFPTLGNLWKSDGTTAGTVVVSNFQQYFQPSFVTAASGRLYFGATSSGQGTELWSSDGTAAGTRLVADIRPGTTGSAPWGLTMLGGELLFTADDGVNGQELWKSDGTSTGTVLVKDVFPGPGSGAGFRPLTRFGGAIYFAGGDAVTGTELWKSDGTANGTTLVRDIFPGWAHSDPSYLNNVNDVLYFTADDGVHGRELWRSDGTTGGTMMLKDVRAGTVASVPEDPRITSLNGSLSFLADGGASGGGHGIWRSDGTESGTQLIALPTRATDSSYPSFFTNVNGTLYFTATFPSPFSRSRTVFRSDATEGGTVPLVAPDGRSPFPRWIAGANGALYVWDDSYLWKSDGSSAGTVILGSLSSGPGASSPAPLGSAGNLLLLKAYTNPGQSLGTELWKTDGTSAGTTFLKDINAGAGDSNPRNATSAGAVMYFTANDGINGEELWKTDGTSVGTVLVKDIRSGTGSSSPSGLTQVNGVLYFSADDGVSGQELWKSDGSEAGTVRVKDLRSGPSGSSPSSLASVNGTLYFSADDGVNGAELWKSDGSDSGTTLVKDLRSGALSSSPSGLVAANGMLFFSAADGVNGEELWKSDGSSAGTQVVRDIRPGGDGSVPLYLTAVRGKLVFTADDGVSGRELWISDGSQGGTAMVGDIYPGAQTSNPYNLTDVDGTLFFSATDPSAANELWALQMEPTATTLTSSTNPSLAGQTLNLAAVVSGSGTPAGSVTFKAGTLVLGTAAVTGGQATLTTSALGAGSHSLTAEYSGRPPFEPSVSAALTQTVNKSATTTSLSAPAGPAGFGSWTALEGQVSIVAPGGGYASGNLLFMENGALLGSAPLHFGRAAIRLATLAMGTHTINAEYQGDTSYTGSVSSAVNATVMPGISIGDASIAEGNSGTRSASLGVTLSASSTDPISVRYTTASGTATAGEDFVASSGLLTFPAGTITGSINLSILGDTKVESNEAFSVVLSDATGAALARSRGQVTIMDDDAAAAVSRKQPSWQEFFAVNPLETPFVGDFNGDGKDDIITFTRQNPNAIGDVYVALSDGAKFGPSAKWHDFFAITTDEAVVVGDYDGDGKDDLATWLFKASREVYVALSTGSGMQTESVWLSSIGTDATDLLFSGDANGDGKSDLIAFARKQGKVYVALSDGTKFAAPTVWHGFFAVSTYERPRVADVNGDGKADIVTFATDSPTAFGDVYVATSDGTQFVGPTGAANDSSKWHDFFAIRPTEEIRVADLNGDGRDDFFTFLPLPWGQAYSVLSRGNAMEDNVLWREDVLFRDTDKVFVGDVNGDGKADIIVFAPAEGKVYVSLAP